MWTIFFSVGNIIVALWLQMVLDDVFIEG